MTYFCPLLFSLPVGIRPNSTGARLAGMVKGMALMLAILGMASCGLFGGGDMAPEPEETLTEAPAAEDTGMGEDSGEEATAGEDGEETPPAEGEPVEAPEAIADEMMEAAEPETMEPQSVPEPDPGLVAMTPSSPAVMTPSVPEPATPTEETVPEFGYLEYADEVPEPAVVPDDLAMLVPDAASPGGGSPVRVAVLHGASEESSGMGVAIVIDVFRSKALERDIGAPVRVIFVSQMSASGPQRNIVRYRDGAMKAAMQVARHLPLNQTVEPMTPDEASRQGVDLIVYLGGGLR